ncbi:MAG TPA: 6-hydroxymethylpterin diphosphokinase MptE-like protein, partial [Gammaproteobacteria bacterium]|nr:6-hydroxymethylpterin diphosphokinase MptE-like protein [Gammaproteobacteria bacterium]
GLLARHIANRELPAGSRYLLVEPAAVADVVREEVGHPADATRFGLADESGWEDCLAAMGFAPYAHRNRVRVVKSLAAQDGFHRDYGPLWRALSARIEYLVWEARVNGILHTHVSKQLENLADNITPAACLRGLLAGKTAVVAGGGPSLDAASGWIRANRAHVVLIAVSRASGPLTDRGLDPDIVVSIDPYDMNCVVSERMLGLEQTTVFAHGFHTSPALVSAWGGRHVFIGPRIPWSSGDLLDNLPQYGPTVTNAAAWLAVELGCDRVVLAGVDFCYSQEGFTHASGSRERNAGPALMQGDQRIETNSGALAETRHEFAQAAGMMGEIAERALEHDCQFINPAPGAARMEHVIHGPLSGVEIDPLPRPARELLWEAVPPDTPEMRLAHCGRMAAELRRALKGVRGVRRLAGVALECNARLSGRGGRRPDPRYKARMERIEARLDSRYGWISRLIKTFELRHVIETVRVDPDAAWTDQELERYADDYYTAYVTSSDELSSALQRALDIVLVRMEEETEPPPIDALTERWGELDQTMRARAWLTAHPRAAKTLTPAQRQAFDDLEERFQGFIRSLADELASGSREKSTLRGLAGRASEYFDQQSRPGLERLARGLALHPDRTEADHYAPLVEGYIHELDGHREPALEAFAAVPPGPCHEDARLRRVLLNLELDRHGEALDLLRGLCEISLYYRPYYGDLQRITGDFQGALDSYTAYLEVAPDDLVTMIKLGTLYHEMGVDEATRWVMEFVLSRDPRNSAARHILGQLDERASGT